MLHKSLLLVAVTLFNGHLFAQFNPDLTYGEVKDVEGNSYKTIVIGTQTWMAENLRTTKYTDGSNIPLITDNSQWESNRLAGTPKLPMMCWYNNDQVTNSANKFGALYNWYAISSSANGNKMICPTGWHIPSFNEWRTLIDFLGGRLIGGGKMKSTGTRYWGSKNTGATNSSGFSGLPAGFRWNSGKFSSIPGITYWWGSEVDEVYSMSYDLVDDNTIIEDYNRAYKTSGFSVRCIKD